MELSDIISIIAIFVSIIATGLSIYLPYYLSNKQNNKEMKNNHISFVFDNYMFEKLPKLLSAMFSSNVRDDYCSPENINRCNDISNLLIQIGELSILYYLANENDTYYEIKRIIVDADECLTRIPDENTTDVYLLIDEFKDCIQKLYQLIFKYNIV